MTYEYACTACGHAWEAEQSISAAALTECPQCHEATAKRQVSGGAGFILKGGGWYADLYSSSGSGKKADSASSTADSSTPSTTAKTESSASTPASTTASGSTPSTGSSSTGAASS